MQSKQEVRSLEGHRVEVIWGALYNYSYFTVSDMVPHDPNPMVG